MADSSDNKLENVRELAEPKAGQKALNYIGLGAVTNSALSIAIAKTFPKLFPGLTEKWAKHYENKYIQKKEAHYIKHFEAALKDQPEAKAAMLNKIHDDAKVYGRKTVEGRLLITGGFIVLPFQAAFFLYTLKENVFAKTRAYSAKHGPDALKTELDRQEQEAKDGDPKYRSTHLNVINKVKEDEAYKQEHGEYQEPKFSPLAAVGDKKEIGIWVTGRILAIGAAFSSQKFMDDKLKKHKNKLDIFLARIVTRMFHGKNYSYSASQKNNPLLGKESEAKDDSQHSDITIENILNTPQSIEAVMGEVKINKFAHRPDLPDDVDPSYYDKVSIATTETVMTTVATSVISKTVKNGDATADRIKEKFETGRDKILSHFNSSKTV